MPQLDIAGYAYKGADMRPEKLIDLLIAEGIATFDARGECAEDVLDEIATNRGIDREDLDSYRADEFPKPIEIDQLTDADRRWYIF